jgi:large subunit ribosomal protein L6
MSRIGLTPVDIPSGVTISVKDNTLTVKGSKGELSQTCHSAITFDVQEKQVMVQRKNEAKQTRALHGLYRSLLNNMVIGVSEGFKRTLLINGVGYRAELQGKNLNFSLGYSHPITYVLPDDVKAEVEGNNKVVLSSISKESIGNVAAEIRSLRPPEPYKGKGIKYEDEYIRRKVGKAGVK